MSGRSTRRRAKTARALASEEQAESEKRPGASTATPAGTKSKRGSAAKPKYPAEAAANGPEASPSLRPRSGTPSSRSSSRATSPSSTPLSLSGRRTSARRPSAAKKPRSSGTATPASRASRSSSVASNGLHGRSVPKLKLKTKHGNSSGRGYNPSAVNYQDSEYHYGSDFEDDEDDAVDPVESDKSSESSEEEDEAEEDAQTPNPKPQTPNPKPQNLT